MGSYEYNPPMSLVRQWEQKQGRANIDKSFGAYRHTQRATMGDWHRRGHDEHVLVGDEVADDGDDGDEDGVSDVARFMGYGRGVIGKRLSYKLE